jgi:hypothetical protein
LRLSHSLGEQPRQMTLWFRRTPTDPGALQIGRGGVDLNPVGVIASATHVELVIAPGQPFARVFDPATGAWSTLADGQVRVVAQR